MAEGSASKPVSLPGKPKAAAVRQGNKVWGMPDYTDADPSKWVVIFPHYLDSTRKRSGGRKIATSKAVESPGANEIFEVVRELGLRTQLELDKAYCRDCWLPGRVRIELFDEAGSPIQPDLARSRKYRATAGSRILNPSLACYAHTAYRLGEWLSNEVLLLLLLSNAV